MDTRAMSVLDKAARIVDPEKGRYSRLARALNESQQTVNNWKRRGIPPAKVLPLVVACRWQITPHEINPELYPADVNWPEGVEVA